MLYLDWYRLKYFYRTLSSRVSCIWTFGQLYLTCKYIWAKCFIIEKIKKISDFCVSLQLLDQFVWELATFGSVCVSLQLLDQFAGELATFGSVCVSLQLLDQFAGELVTFGSVCGRAWNFWITWSQSPCGVEMFIFP